MGKKNFLIIFVFQGSILIEKPIFTITIIETMILNPVDSLKVIGLAGGINTYGYVGNNPLTFSDLFGLDATRRFNTTAGRGYLDGPTNGNWGGKCWSGGTYSCGGDRPVGKLPPTDSGDACYKAHDECYGAPACNTSDPSKNKIGIKDCDQALLQCLGSLPEDPRLWPQPPRPGTEDETRLYRDGALLWFR